MVKKLVLQISEKIFNKSNFKNYMLFYILNKLDLKY